jgi:hypothetical protein
MRVVVTYFVPHFTTIATFMRVNVSLHFSLSLSPVLLNFMAIVDES